MFAGQPLASSPTARLRRVCVVVMLCAIAGTPGPAGAAEIHPALPPATHVAPVAPLETVAAPPMATRDAVPRWVKGAILGGMGLISAGIGTWAGLEALDKTRAAEPDCATDLYDDVCNPRGLALRADARKYTNTATIGISLAPPLLAFSIWLLVTAPSSWEQRTTAGGPAASTGLRVSVVPGGVFVGRQF